MKNARQIAFIELNFQPEKFVTIIQYAKPIS